MFDFNAVLEATEARVYGPTRVNIITEEPTPVAPVVNRIAERLTDLDAEAAATSTAELVKRRGLDWTVEKRPMSYRRADGSYADSHDTFAIVRTDTEKQLGTVGTRYQPIQNGTGFSFLDSVVGEFRGKYHNAGALFGGKKVYMQIELPEHGFTVARGDEQKAYATFTNCHDGTGKAHCFPSVTRIICANTFRTAIATRTSGLSIRHTGDIRASVADAREAMGLAVRGIDRFKDVAEVMVRTPCNAPQFFSDLLDAVLDVTAAESMRGADALAAAIAKTTAQQEFERKRIQKQIDHRGNVLEDILRRYESEKCGTGGIRGTTWSAFQAVTEFADHSKPRRQVGSTEDRQSRRFESNLIGDSDAMKQTAFEMLTQTLKA